jgi:hypothetical protein
MENDRVFALLLFGGSGWIVREWGEMMTLSSQLSSFLYGASHCEALLSVSG